MRAAVNASEHSLTLLLMINMLTPVSNSAELLTQEALRRQTEAFKSARARVSHKLIHKHK